VTRFDDRRAVCEDAPETATRRFVEAASALLDYLADYEYEEMFRDGHEAAIGL
jgi:hypothetical protein